MLRTLTDLEDYSIDATDGTIGQVKDFYFDDEAWVIRYFVVETGTWHSKRKVLISPLVLGKPNWEARLLSVPITKQQVKDSPNIDTDKPVTRQHAATYLDPHYDYPCYWNGPAPADHITAVLQMHDDHHLRSCKAIMTYHVHATDGEIGHVQGFLVDEETWSIRYMIVNTSNWWGGHHVLVAPQWISDVEWEGFTVAVDLTRDAVKSSPPYRSASQLDRDQELRIYRHYGRRGYWNDEPRRHTTESTV
jgi:hypothetical protein